MGSEMCIRDRWSSEVEDDEVAAVFAEYAEDEGLHAARLLELLQEREK